MASYKQKEERRLRRSGRPQNLQRLVARSRVTAPPVVRRVVAGTEHLPFPVGVTSITTEPLVWAVVCDTRVHAATSFNRAVDEFRLLPTRHDCQLGHHLEQVCWTRTDQSNTTSYEQWLRGGRAEVPQPDLAVVAEAQADLHEALGSNTMANALRMYQRVTGAEQA